MPDSAPPPDPVALLAEARQLSAQVFGRDPVATEMPPDMRVRSEPTSPPAAPAEPAADTSDPDPSRPFLVDADRVHAALEAKLPAIATELGLEGVADASSTLARLPREITTLLDSEGALASPLTWHLMGQLERNAATAPTQDGAGIELEPAALGAWAREQGLADDPETISNVAILVRALPPRIRSGISEAMARDPDLWGLAAHLGGRLWKG